MFDNNPFREFKKIMKERNLKEEGERLNPQDGFTGEEGNNDAKTEHGHYLNQITNELSSAIQTGDHNNVHRLFKKHHKDLTPDHLDMITSMRIVTGSIGFHDLVREVPLHPSATDEHKKWARNGEYHIKVWANEPLPPGSKITD